MKKPLNLRISDVLLRTLLLLIVGMYVYIKCTATAAGGDVKIAAKQDTISYYGQQILESIKDGAWHLDDVPAYPGTFYLKKIQQRPIYSY